MTTIDAPGPPGDAAGGLPVSEAEADAALRLSTAASHALHLADGEGLIRCFGAAGRVVSGSNALLASRYVAGVNRSPATTLSRVERPAGRQPKSPTGG